MRTIGVTLFDTAIGACGLAWDADGIVGVQLPGRSRGATRATLQRRFPGAAARPAPDHTRRAVELIAQHLAGTPAELSEIPLRLGDVAPFERRVYEVVRAIPRGATLTYGEVARRLGEPDAREVGRALGRNPFPIVVPCHRVLAAGGRLGGFSAVGGVATKLRLLAIEGLSPAGEPTLFGNLPIQGPGRSGHPPLRPSGT